jgi:hypothetical protein
MVFSSSADGTGIVEQTRFIMRVDSTQWPTNRIVNSVNNYLDTVTGYAIGADRRFQFDDTNHSKLPIGTTNLIANQSDYSFLLDEQGNAILNLERVDILDSGGFWHQLYPRDQAEIGRAIAEDQRTAGLPVYYDKIADNIVRLSPKPIASVTSGLKFFFQRMPSYFVSTDTTKAPGVPPLLHRGFVINSAYDGALTLGLQNLNSLAAERQLEERKMTDYFLNRNTDEHKYVRAVIRSSR